MSLTKQTYQKQYNRGVVPKTNHPEEGRKRSRRYKRLDDKKKSKKKVKEYYPYIGVEKTEKRDKCIYWGMMISCALMIVFGIAAFGVWKYGDQSKAEDATDASKTV